MFKKLLEFINRPTRAAEILRFLIVGGLATVVDMFMTGVTLYIFDPNLYPNFFNVFIGSAEPALIAKLVGTGVGFLFGLVANYVLSVIFVFNEKGKSKTTKGFLIFAFFSAIGLLIHEFGMYLLSDILGVNVWITKIVLTVVVLIYNYVSRKLFIFRKTGGDNKDENQSDNSML